MIDKRKIYNLTSVLSNVIIVLATFFLIVHLSAPFLGGKLLVDAIIKYSSWFGIALALKIIVKRRKKDVGISWYEYALISILGVFYVAVWFSYPFNIFLSLLVIAGLAASYRANKKRMKNDLFTK